MARVAESAESPIIIENSFKEENDEIRTAYLEHGSLWLAQSLFRKYKEWYLKKYGKEFVEQVFDGENDDESDEYFEDEKEDEIPSWVNCYLNPSTYVPAVDDKEDSDDELDSERRCAIDVPKGDTEGAHLRQMMQSFGSMIGKEKMNDEVVTNFLSVLNENTKTFNKNRKKIFKLKIKLLNTKEDIYRTVQVPGSLSLAALQEKVLCPMAGWLPNLRIHTFYLPGYLYKDGERPEDPEKDLCLGPVDMLDPSGFCFQIKRGGKHMVDDRIVPVFQLFFHEDDYIFYKHGNQKFAGTILPFKLILLEIEDHPSGDPTMKDIRVLDGKGILPDESGSWQHPYREDDEIDGVKAFCISIDILRNPNSHPAWAVERARKHLRVESTTNFDLSKFDAKKEQKLVSEAVSKFLLKRGTAGTPMDMMEFMFMGLMGPSPGEGGSKQMCLNCRLEERSLNPGKKLLRCSRCGNAVYCGEKCQREDWNIHKNVCVRAELVKNQVPQIRGQKKHKKSKKF